MLFAKRTISALFLLASLSLASCGILSFNSTSGLCTEASAPCDVNNATTWDNIKIPTEDDDVVIDVSAQAPTKFYFFHNVSNIWRSRTIQLKGPVQLDNRGSIYTTLAVTLQEESLLLNTGDIEIKNALSLSGAGFKHDAGTVKVNSFSDSHTAPSNLWVRNNATFEVETNLILYNTSVYVDNANITSDYATFNHLIARRSSQIKISDDCHILDADFSDTSSVYVARGKLWLGNALFTGDAQIEVNTLYLQGVSNISHFGPQDTSVPFVVVISGNAMIDHSMIGPNTVLNITNSTVHFNTIYVLPGKGKLQVDVENGAMTTDDVLANATVYLWSAVFKAKNVQATYVHAVNSSFGVSGFLSSDYNNITDWYFDFQSMFVLGGGALIAVDFHTSANLVVNNSQLIVHANQVIFEDCYFGKGAEVAVSLGGQLHCYKILESNLDALSLTPGIFKVAVQGMLRSKVIHMVASHDQTIIDCGTGRIDTDLLWVSQSLAKDAGTVSASIYGDVTVHSEYEALQFSAKKSTVKVSGTFDFTGANITVDSSIVELWGSSKYTYNLITANKIVGDRNNVKVLGPFAEKQKISHSSTSISVQFTKDKPSTGLSSGAIAGIVIACLVGVVVVAAVLYRFRDRLFGAKKPAEYSRLL